MATTTRTYTATTRTLPPLLQLATVTCAHCGKGLQGHAAHRVQTLGYNGWATTAYYCAATNCLWVAQQGGTA